MGHTKAQLMMFNEQLDKTCVDLTERLNAKQQEVEILKGIISLMMMGNESNERMIKLVKPDPLHIKIENDWCTIKMGGIENATMQEEN